MAAKSLGVSYKKLTAELTKIGLSCYMRELLVPQSQVVARIAALKKVENEVVSD